MKDNEIKNFYSCYNDKIIEKRFNSKFKLRSYAHYQQYESILKFINSGISVLDAGCGEGVLSVMAAKKGADVTGSDISQPNIKRCIKYALENEVKDKTNFVVADLEDLPFPDNSFDLVVSSHVLEHIPNFDKGLKEIMRVSKKRAVIAIPTVLNFCSCVQVGRSMFWIKSPRSFMALFVGFVKIIFAFIFGAEGVNESYAGQSNIPHIFRFPYIMKKKIKKMGFLLVGYEASSICLPFFEFLLPIIKFFDKYKDKKVLRNFGYGTTYIIEKN